MDKEGCGEEGWQELDAGSELSNLDGLAQILVSSTYDPILGFIFLKTEISARNQDSTGSLVHSHFAFELHRLVDEWRLTVGWLLRNR